MDGFPNFRRSSSYRIEEFLELRMKPVQPRSWIIGGAIAVVLGLSVAVYFSFADWRLNPGGIFRDESGTHWDVVFETLFSWFLPIALIVFLPATALHYWLAPRAGHE